MSDYDENSDETQQAFLDELRSLKTALDAEDEAAIPTLSDVVNYGNPAARRETGFSDASNSEYSTESLERIDAHLSTTLDTLKQQANDDIPLLTDVAEASPQSEHSLDELLAYGPKFSLYEAELDAGLDDGHAKPLPVREKINSKEALFEQLEKEAHQLLDELVTRHTTLIREELIARLDDVKHSLLEELKQSSQE
ncbi:MAG: hypothetical protein ACR2PS_17275 [Pseudomonadales bacterium]